MDDYENDGRDYNENIDEGPNANVVNEFNFFTKKSNADESKPGAPDKNSSDVRKGRPCHCKNSNKRKINRNNDGNDTNGTSGSNNKKNSESSKRNGQRRRKKKERSLVNPFIIFYLEMYYKKPTPCVATHAIEAGRIWSKMSAKEKEEYISKARLASAKSKSAKLDSKKMKKDKMLKKTRKKC